MRGRWLLFAGTLILAAAAAGALTWLKRGAPQPSKPPAEPAAVHAAGRDLSLPGKIQAQHVVPVGAAVTGTIESLLVDVGQDVFEGQLLAHIGGHGLDSAREEASRSAQTAQEKVNAIESRISAARLEASRSRADANRARSQFERAEKTYQRQQMLNREGATPHLVYEKSEREFETARTEFNSLDELARQAENRAGQLTHELEAAKRALDDRNAELESATAEAAGAEIRSPVSGVVVAHKGDPGKALQPDEAKDLFEIAVDLSQLAVEIQPDPAALKRLRPGMDALLFVADFPGAIPGTVKEVRAADAIVEFTSPSAVIRPGMTAQVRLRLE
jgi:multidrug resistance efflux pump